MSPEDKNATTNSEISNIPDSTTSLISLSERRKANQALIKAINQISGEIPQSKIDITPIIKEVTLPFGNDNNARRISRDNPYIN
jgi:hypothetical protein